MTAFLAALLGLLAGAAITAGLFLLRREAVGVAPRPAPDDALLGSAPDDGPPTEAAAEVREAVLDRAPVAVLVLDDDDDLVLANRRAGALGLLARRGGVVEPLRELARLGRGGEEVTREVSLTTSRIPLTTIQARVRVLPLPERSVGLVVEDVTEAHRVDLVRRDFVANVSHEIKTPVGALRLLADAALESVGEPEGAETTRHFLERIAHESARLGRLVSELLDLSRLQGAEARPTSVSVRLDDVVTEAMDRAAPHADAKEITVARGAPSGAVVEGVESQLVTAVANLLDNAINYSPDGTRVGIAIKRRDVAWEITVTDQGLGIPEADQDRIFERFYRVDPARSRATGGTGLGLAIVKHVVRNHGGEVKVWSAPGAGSTFTLCLPFTAPASGAGPDLDQPVAAGRTTESSDAPAQPPAQARERGARVTRRRTAASGRRSAR